MDKKTNKDPLHGMTLKAILIHLEAYYGWEYLGEQVSIKCFNNDPSINSSLKFLRKTPWARTKVETLYCDSLNPSAYKKQTCIKKAP
jgi:uncharacterized protein (DUF2132 family)